MSAPRKLFNVILFLTMSFTALTTLSAQQQDKPAGAGKAEFVIVHGAWGGSWAFRRVETLLREKGSLVHRPSLTGLGERVHLATPGVGLSTHIDDVVNMILFEDLKDVVLVGHSYGGMVITGVADRIPERIKKLIYIDAFVPADGDSVQTLSGARAEWWKPMVKGDYIVPGWVKPEQPLPKDVPQPLKTFTETLVLRHKNARVPALYILTVDAGSDPQKDTFSPQAERAKTRGWTIATLTADHNPQWSAPEALVDLLDRNK
jgi:pimeloyl-ACP methyl ester carboxylesterase